MDEYLSCPFCGGGWISIDKDEETVIWECGSEKGPNYLIQSKQCEIDLELYRKMIRIHKYITGRTKDGG